MLEAVPDLMAAHPFDAHSPDEEIMLLEHSFYSTNTEAFAAIPSYAAWCDAQDQAPGYAYLRRLLQLLQWQKKRQGATGHRWVLKSPHHLGFMDALFAEFLTPMANQGLTEEQARAILEYFRSIDAENVDAENADEGQ